MDTGPGRQPQPLHEGRASRIGAERVEACDCDERQGVGELGRDLKKPLERQAVLRDEAVEGLTLDELRRQEVDAVGLLDRLEFRSPSA